MIKHETSDLACMLVLFTYRGFPASQSQWSSHATGYATGYTSSLFTQQILFQLEPLLMLLIGLSSSMAL